MTRKPLWLLLVLVALWMLASAPGRAQQYSFQAFDRKAGLESQTINCMLQDWRGFIWACSEMGLYRFDGSSFQRMGREQGFVRGEYVTAIAQDASRQRIWVATQSGLRVGDGLNFENVEPEHKPLVVDVGRKLAVLDDGAGPARVATAADVRCRQRGRPSGAGQYH
jgi:ligand-binding sensor domain-containing protein